MARAFHLGAEGEEAARHLLDVYDLSSIFEPCLLISPHGKALDEIRRRLAKRAARLEHWEPGKDLTARVRKLGTLATDGRPVIWLQQRRFEPEAWSYALASLNQQREFYRTRAPWMWVITGPPELVEIVHDKAMHLLTGIAVRRSIHESPRALPTIPSRPIRWLHLSDFHFQALERWERRPTLKALLRHAAGLKVRALAPEFVFVTGDIAASGKNKEYLQAERFLADLADALGLEPGQHFFLVPGNHDVDRGAIGPADGFILDALKSQEAIERVFGDPRTMDLLARRLDTFYDFTQRFLGSMHGLRADRPWRFDMRQTDGLPVGILQLNSAWASGADEEQGRLLIGEPQLVQALEESGDAFLKIALVHHPLAALASFDRERMEAILDGSSGVHFLLRGHQHADRATARRTPGGFLTEIAPGAVYTGDSRPESYCLTEANLVSGEARVQFFTYGRSQWRANTLAFERAREDLASLELPLSLKLGT